MTFGSNRGQLDDAQQVARAHWASTAEQWHDDVQKHHDTELAQPLDEHVTKLLRAVDQLALLVAQVRRECELTPEALIASR